MIDLAVRSDKHGALRCGLSNSIQSLSMILPHEVHALFWFGAQPMVVAVLGQDDHHALFIHGFVKLAHQVMTVSIVKLCTIPLDDFHDDHRPATPSGSPSAFEMRVGMALPLRQSGSKMASAGTMQCWAFFQASRKLDLLATVSLRALKVRRPMVASVDQCGIRPNKPCIASRSGTASSPTSASLGRRIKVAP